MTDKNEPGTGSSPARNRGGRAGPGPGPPAPVEASLSFIRRRARTPRRTGSVSSGQSAQRASGLSRLPRSYCSSHSSSRSRIFSSPDMSHLECGQASGGSPPRAAANRSLADCQWRLTVR